MGVRKRADAFDEEWRELHDEWHNKCDDCCPVVGCDSCGYCPPHDGACPRCGGEHFEHYHGQSIKHLDVGEHQPLPKPGLHPYQPDWSQMRSESMRKIAHDSGDGETIYHCPFCGSGQVIARSDRSIECEFCHQNFTVQVQPQYPAFPQTIDGMPVDIPGMPGQVNAGDPAGLPPVDPDQVDEEGNVPPEEQEGEEEPEQEEGGNAPPWEKQSFRTTAGRRLAGDDYIRHLAIRYAGDRKHMAARIKEERQG